VSHKIDRLELTAARTEAAQALSRYLNISATAGEKLRDELLSWLALEMAMAIQDRDEKGAWP
jgi:Fe-S cluster assembly ATPase SufC